MARASRQAPAQHVPGWAGSLPDRYLHCRDMGHSWKAWSASWSSTDRAYLRTLRCISCHTERVQRVSQSGHIEAGHYVYPDGYLAPRGGGQLEAADRDSLRLEALIRLTEGSSNVIKLPGTTKRRKAG